MSNLARACSIVGIAVIAACSKSSGTASTSACAYHAASLQSLTVVPDYLQVYPETQEFYCQAALLHDLIHLRDAEQHHRDLLTADLAKPGDEMHEGELRLAHDESDAKLAGLNLQIAAARASANPLLASDAGVRLGLSSYFYREVATHAKTLLASCKADDDAHEEEELRHYLVSVDHALSEHEEDGSTAGHGLFLRQIISDIKQKDCP